MSFKLAVVGKGGVGKTFLAGTLARLFADDGKNVLAQPRLNPRSDKPRDLPACTRSSAGSYENSG